MSEFPEFSDAVCPVKWDHNGRSIAEDLQAAMNEIKRQSSLPPIKCRNRFGVSLTPGNGIHEEDGWIVYTRSFTPQFVRCLIGQNFQRPVMGMTMGDIRQAFVDAGLDPVVEMYRLEIWYVQRRIMRVVFAPVNWVRRKITLWKYRKDLY
jgi:hypothetical protein